MPHTKVNMLIEKGVHFPNPDMVVIDDELNPDRISGKGVVIHPGCRIFGQETLIHSGVVLGYESPVTIENCYIGADVHLRGGFFRKAVFLKGASMGSGAHVREGTIFEEGANAAHAVGVKQTILFPFVTLGSLINFCDCLMAGGTSRKDHSEVGSSYIHFNYTPNQDKATPSMMGDVAHGVMINQRPIFLGGQGGLVGPCRIDYGTIIAAGSIYRKDQLKPGRLVFDGNTKSGSVPFVSGIYRNVSRVVKNNTLYIANLLALKQWYLNVRSLFVSDDFPPILFNGLCATLDLAIRERIKRFGLFIENVPESLRIYQDRYKEKTSGTLIRQKKELYEKKERIQAVFNSALDQQRYSEGLETFLEKISAGISANGKDYINVIKWLNTGDAGQGTRWLQGIVDRIVEEVAAEIPSIY